MKNFTIKSPILISAFIFVFVCGLLIGFLTNEVLFPPKTEIKTFKIPVRIPEIRKVVVVLPDTILQKNLVSVIESLQKELEIAKLSQQFLWKTWKYDDKYLTAQIKYWGLLKDFEYTIKQRDTVIQYQTVFKYKQRTDWKMNLLFGLGGFIAGYVIASK